MLKQLTTKDEPGDVQIANIDVGCIDLGGQIGNLLCEISYHFCCGHRGSSVQGMSNGCWRWDVGYKSALSWQFSWQLARCGASYMYGLGLMFPCGLIAATFTAKGVHLLAGGAICLQSF